MLKNQIVWDGGFATADVSNADNLRILSGVDALNIGGKVVKPNGSGLAVSVGSPANLGNVLDVLNASNPSNTAGFITRIPLPADPFSVAIGAGIAFVAGGTAGLQVVNYRSFDNQGVPPTITLTNSFIMTSPTNGAAEEGKLVRVTARVTDDVQVRHVEFYIDGVRAFTDASFPFEHRFVTPVVSAAKTNFALRTRAFDTGGNSTWTDVIVVNLTHDLSPPRLIRAIPANGTELVVVEAVGAYFDEPVSSNSVTASTFRLVEAGADGVIGTGDDVTVTNGTRSVEVDQMAVFMRFAAPLGVGRYQAILSPPFGNVAELGITNNLTWQFRVLPTTTIRGVVVGLGGLPVAGATIIVLGSELAPVTSDAQGRFEIASVPLPSATLIIRVQAVVAGTSMEAVIEVSAVPGGETMLGTVALAPVVQAPSVRLAVGVRHAVAVRQNGTLWAWGGNELGQLGDGTLINRTEPVPIATNSIWSTVAAGWFHTVAIRFDGTLWAWGTNGHGQLGDGTFFNRNLPVQIGTNTNWKAVSAGFYHTVALRSDGSLWACGDNSAGQLGDGTFTARNSLVRVGTASNWQSISAGGGCGTIVFGPSGVTCPFDDSVAYTLAIQADGTLWSWGANQVGQLGLGNGMPSTNQPTRIGNMTGWRLAVCGYAHALAIHSDGTLWSWGFNHYGALGDGTFVNRSQPVRVGTNSNWSTVSTGFESTAAIDAGGKTWVWGFIDPGDLGEGFPESWPEPIIGPPFMDGRFVAVGIGNTALTRANGTLWTWGLSAFEPVQVGTNTNW